MLSGHMMPGTLGFSQAHRAGVVVKSVKLGYDYASIVTFESRTLIYVTRVLWIEIMWLPFLNALGFYKNKIIIFIEIDHTGT